MPVRLNITIDEGVYKRLKKEVPPKKISSFINAAVREKLYPDKKTLDNAYKAASRERWRAELEKDWSVTEVEGWPE
jgi:predicted CopG family antitoxin